MSELTEAETMNRRASMDATGTQMGRLNRDADAEPPLPLPELQLIPQALVDELCRLTAECNRLLAAWEGET